MTIKFGSICSGIESASIAWEPLGMHPSWFSEIEKFPSAVLDYHWPLIANMGDMCQLPAMVAAGLVQAPDILVGGTPCQAFSVAGLRKGLEDERGQLTLKYVELLDEIDKQRPNDECVAVWENVPGVLSSKDNAFGCFLGALAGEDCELYPSGEKWTKSGCVYGPKRTIAWRILDAQYFGVAQRRRRVFVVASARDGFDPTKVLFESEGERRDIAPSRETGENITRTTSDSFRNSSFGGWSKDNVNGTLKARGGPLEGGSESLVIHGTQDPCVSKNLAFALNRNNGQENVILPIHDKTTRNNGKTGVGSGNGFGVGKESDPMFTLTTGDKHAVYAFDSLSSNSMKSKNPNSGCREVNLSKCIDTHYNCPSKNQGGNAVLSESTVRRLTPIECERLQGFPDNHTQIPYRNKSAEDCPDGPRYKAIGNSKAVPVIRWVGKRILKQLLTKI